MSRRTVTRFFRGLVVIAVGVLLFSAVCYAIPQTINYQGYLTDSTGNPLEGTVSIVFKLYTAATGGSPLWAETQAGVQVTGGIFSVNLGSIAAIALPFDTPYYLGITVGADAEMTPRQPLTSVGYAYRAGTADAVASGGIQSYMLSDDAVTADKIHDGAIESTHLNTGAVTADKLGDNAVTGAKIADNTVTAADIVGGTGSLLDADKLDGHEASDFVLTGADNWVDVTGDTMTGQLTITKETGPGLSSTTSTGNAVYGHATGYGGFGVMGESDGTDGRGVFGQNASTSGVGVYGYTPSATGTTYGVMGQSASTAGYGVWGWANAATGTNYGVYGQSDSTSGRGVYGTAPFDGVYGFASAATGINYGVVGSSASTSGRGVYGYAYAASGTTYGVYGRSDSDSGYGVYGRATAGYYGVYGESNRFDGYGVYGLATATSGPNYGVYGRSTSNSNGHGVFGDATATAGTTYGVIGQSASASGYGVYGIANAATGTTYGVLGRSNSIAGYGVYGQAAAASGTNYGVYGVSNSTAGYDFYAGGNGNYGPFTGAHEAKLAGNFPPKVEPGLIVVATGQAQRRQNADGTVNLSSTLPTIKLADQPHDKAVFGVLVAEATLPQDHWYKAQEGERFATVNALGEGRVWVTDGNGAIETGDYITTSAIPGYGQRQDDDLVHSYTMGKAIETVDWDTVIETVKINGKTYKVYLIAVVYTSG